MTTKTHVSPIGTPADDVAHERAAQSAEYRAERDSLVFWSDIAAQIIVFRTRHGISQADLAKRIGTSYSAISRLESGQHATSGETLRRIAQALNLQIRFELRESPMEEAEREIVSA